jgi:predicted nucleic acid-binding protein
MAVAGRPFFDTSVLVSGLIELGDASEPARRILGGIKAGRIRHAHTAWHCCLEFFSVATRLPAGLRLDPRDAWGLMNESVFGLFCVCDVPDAARVPFLREAASQGIAGGRVYDAHIAEAARLAESKIVVTDNPRHFAQLLRHAIRVTSAQEFVDGAGL